MDEKGKARKWLMSWTKRKLVDFMLMSASLARITRWAEEYDQANTEE